jgi:hypothetical protein
MLPLLLAGLLLAACAPPPTRAPDQPWRYADLRTISAPSVLPPSFDLVAAYTRLAGDDLQIRLDLLALDPQPAFDLYLALDTSPGGRRDLPFGGEADLAWDTLLSLPAAGGPAALQAGQPGSTLQADARLIPRLVRYPWLDALVVSLNANNLPGVRERFTLQAYVLPAGSTSVVNRIGPVSSQALPPGRAPLVLAFWNTFPAYTPAQALRRWDGAHTGPYGERHGLRLLLRAVRRYRVPVVLLDLKTPASLSALDYLGRLPQIQNLASQGLLVLPDALPGSPDFPYFPSGLPEWAWEQALVDSRRAGLTFGLRASPFLYAPTLPAGMTPGYPVIFMSLPGDQPAVWQGHTLLPLPSTGPEPQVDPGGPSLELNTALLRNAAASDQGRSPIQPVLLGGDLTDSPFADPQVAESVLNYIAAHPWIQPLGGDDLITLRPAEQPILLSSPQAAPFSPLLEDLPAPADGSQPLRLAAWQAALALYAALPPDPPQLAGLRALYSGLPGLLAEAGRWAENPVSLQDCSRDLDLDGQAECLLASPRRLAVIDPLGGRLVMLFARTTAGVHQLLGPTSQLIVGLSDPSEWELGAGEGAEPGGVQGAFADSRPPWPAYQVESLADGLRLTSPDGQVQKTFRLTPAGLRVDYQALSPVQVEVPIVIDPWQRFQPGWADRYRFESLPDGYAWRLGDGSRLEVRESLGLQAAAFTDSRPQLALAEDPNFAYPPGHYLPFPVILLSGSGQGEFWVVFSIIED